MAFLRKSNQLFVSLGDPGGVVSLGFFLDGLMSGRTTPLWVNL